MKTQRLIGSIDDISVELHNDVTSHSIRVTWRALVCAQVVAHTSDLPKPPKPVPANWLVSAASGGLRGLLLEVEKAVLANLKAKPLAGLTDAKGNLL